MPDRHMATLIALADAREAVEQTRRTLAESRASLAATWERLQYVVRIIEESRQILDGQNATRPG